jgi:hypothetical protein
MQWIARIEVWRSPGGGRYAHCPNQKVVYVHRAQFVQFIRRPIEAGDETLIGFIGPHIDAALIDKQCTRASLARKVLDAFPDRRRMHSRTGG